MGKQNKPKKDEFGVHKSWRVIYAFEIWTFNYVLYACFGVKLQNITSVEQKIL